MVRAAASKDTARGGTDDEPRSGVVFFFFFRTETCRMSDSQREAAALLPHCCGKHKLPLLLEIAYGKGIYHAGGSDRAREGEVPLGKH